MSELDQIARLLAIVWQILKVIVLILRELD